MSIYTEEWIHETETTVIGAVDVPVAHVPDSETEAFDGQLQDAGSPVEIKTCQAEITDRSRADGVRPGRWLLQEPAHEELREIGGIYLLAVLDEDRVLSWVWSSPKALDPLLSWSPSGRGKPRGDVAQVPWPKLVDPEDVEAARDREAEAEGVAT